jgi:hypothetical protein
MSIIAISINASVLLANVFKEQENEHEDEQVQIIWCLSSPSPCIGHQMCGCIERDFIEASVQSQADSGLPTQLIPIAFRRVNHTFLYLYPRDT